MPERFIKFIPGQSSSHLRNNYPNAFLLLSLIAERARRVSGDPDGLQIGDALLGDYKEAGLTRQQYRTAIEKLTELKHITIIWNGKKFLQREKSTIKITISGMLVNLTSSSVWDINSEDTNQPINQRATNEQPTSNHEEERIRKKKKEKEEIHPLPPKISFREFVTLTQEQYDKLLADDGPELLASKLDFLDSYKGSKGKKYDSDFHVMKKGGWLDKKAKEGTLNGTNTPKPALNGSYHSTTDRQTKNRDGKPVDASCYNLF